MTFALGYNQNEQRINYGIRAHLRRLKGADLEDMVQNVLTQMVLDYDNWGQDIISLCRRSCQRVLVRHGRQIDNQEGVEFQPLTNNEVVEPSQSLQEAIEPLKTHNLFGYQVLHLRSLGYNFREISVKTQNNMTAVAREYKKSIEYLRRYHA